MPVVDRNGPIADSWVRIADDAPIPQGASVIVSLARLKNDNNAVFAAAKAVGIEFTGDVDLDEVVPYLPQLSLVVARLTVMRDGRPFSIGRLLRERYNYKGDLRAAGPFIPDQVLFLLRVGFTTFDVDEDFSIDALKHSVAAYTAWYQRSADRATPTVVELRHPDIKS
jgi:uncharacterized protein (DUF934 family)